MNSSPNKYPPKFPMAHLTLSASPTKMCLDFSSGNTVDIDMKDIGRRRIISRDFPNSHFSSSFYFSSDFIASAETYACISTAPIPSLYQYTLMEKFLDGYGLSEVGLDKISFFNRSSNIWSSGFHRFCIS